MYTHKVIIDGFCRTGGCSARTYDKAQRLTQSPEMSRHRTANEYHHKACKTFIYAVRHFLSCFMQNRSQTISVTTAAISSLCRTVPSMIALRSRSGTLSAARRLTCDGTNRGTSVATVSLSLRSQPSKGTATEHTHIAFLWYIRNR